MANYTSKVTHVGVHRVDTMFQHVFVLLVQFALVCLALSETGIALLQGDYRNFFVRSMFTLIPLFVGLSLLALFVI